MMRRAAITVYIVVSLPVLFIAACSGLEDTSAEYENFEGLSTAIQRGWIPDYFPGSATDITEHHNIDSNHVYADFLHDGTDEATLERICMLMAKTDAGVKFVCPPFEEATHIIILRADGTGSYERISEGI